jgi:hypothetical protein
MPARNAKAMIMGEIRVRVFREMSREHPRPHTVWADLNQWLCFATLSRKNILWAAGHVQTLRSHPDLVNNLEFHEKLDRLDRAVAEAKARFQRREEKREKIKAAAEPKEPKVDGRRKLVEPLAPVSPVAQGDLLKRLLAQQQQQKEKS